MQNSRREHAEALYYHIAGDALKHAQREAQKGKDEFRLAQYVCTSIIFSAFALEAYINQEYTFHSQTATINLQNFSLSNKWI